MGVRYEYSLPPRTADDTLLRFGPASKSVILGRSMDMGVKYTTAKDVQRPESLIYPNKWDFGPRLGFAYRIGSLNHPTVIRGGYGLRCRSRGLGTDY